MKLASKIVPLLGAGLLIAGVALAQTTNSNSNTNTTNSTNAVVSKNVNLPCIQAAIGKREDAIIAAVTAFHGSITTTLQTRKTELNAAWSIVVAKDRKMAIRQVWKKFQQAERQANKIKRAAKGAAWKQYRVDRRACGPAHATDDLGTESSDSQL